jgi:D-glycero-D-manno-heptose 1,7-bisphosphate phosphatase
VFFDRDGVLNEAPVRDGTPRAPVTVTDLQITAGAAAAVAAVRDAGFLAIAVTNQPDVVRGRATRADVEAINATIVRELRLDALYVCFHDSGDGCDCRKPKPGMVRAASADYDIDVRASYLIGDRAGDVECGRAAGCSTVFIDRGYAETPAGVPADVTVSTLSDAVDAILQRESVMR